MSYNMTVLGNQSSLPELTLYLNNQTNGILGLMIYFLVLFLVINSLIKNGENNQRAIVTGLFFCTVLLVLMSTVGLIKTSIGVALLIGQILIIVLMLSTKNID